MITEVYDLETLSNLFTYTGYSLQDGKFHQFVIHSSINQSEELYKHLHRDKQIFQVGFNNESFDYPVLHHFILNYERYKYMDGYEIATDLYNKAQELIDSNEFTSISDKLKRIKQYDLFKIWHYDNKARLTSLKDLQFALRMRNIEEMPYDHRQWITTQEQIDKVLKYNKNDVIATKMFLDVTLGKTDYPIYKGKDIMKLRKTLSDSFGLVCHNLPDTSIGESLLLKLYSKVTNQSEWDVKKQRTHRSIIHLKECLPLWMNIKTKEFQNFVNVIKDTSINPNIESKFEYSVIFHGIKFDFGLGGSHGCIESGVYKSDEENVILDLDVASLYPGLANSLGLYPQHLGTEFLSLYSKFMYDRLNEKKKPKKEQNMVLIEGYKLMLNGGYGKSNSEFSFLYDPLYTFKTTIAGQIFIAMWAERMVEAVPNLEFIQINTK